MADEFRGGNSRTLAKLLDLFDHPVAVLDARGSIAFVNAALCAMVQTEAIDLVGQVCSWAVATDQSKHAALLTALAPPASVREGRVVVRRLTTPVVFGAEATGQLFVPLVDRDEVAHATLVCFGDWESLARQTSAVAARGEPTGASLPTDAATSLVQVRSRWKSLDGLHALIGESSAINLAMRRAQMAVQAGGDVFIAGPAGGGKVEIARAIFKGRLKLAGLQPIAGQFFPIECGLMEVTLLQGMLEVFSGRLRNESPKVAQQLTLQNIDLLPRAAYPLLNHWLDEYSQRCVVVATSEKLLRDADHEDLAAHAFFTRIATTEIVVPGLRERRDDVPTLVMQAVAEECKNADRAILSVAPDAMDLLVAYPWHRNLQELREAIRAAVKHAVLTKAIQPSHLPVEIRTLPSSLLQVAAPHVEPIHLDTILEDVERVILRRALKRSPRNRAQVARWLNISRPRLLRRITQLGLEDTQPATEAKDDEA